MNNEIWKCDVEIMALIVKEIPLAWFGRIFKNYETHCCPNKGFPKRFTTLVASYADALWARPESGKVA